MGHHEIKDSSGKGGPPRHQTTGLRSDFEYYTDSVLSAVPRSTIKIAIGVQYYTSRIIAVTSASEVVKRGIYPLIF